MTDLTILEASNVLEIGAGLIVALYFFSILWRKHWEDTGRQQLFLLRDRLFDYWLDHPEELPEETYRNIRAYLNGSIRFTHIVSFSSFVFASLFLQTETRDEKPRIILDIESIKDANAQKFVRDTVVQAISIQVGSACVRSLFGLVCLLLFAPVFVIAKALRLRGGSFPGQFVERMRKIAAIESQAA